MATQAQIDAAHAAYAKLQASPSCHSLLKKYLTEDVLRLTAPRRTAMGATLMDVIQSGVQNLDSGCGVYAPDAEAYHTFAPLFDPIIEDYHQGFRPGDRQPAVDFGRPDEFVDLDPTGAFIRSTRVRCGRSLAGFPFNPLLTEAQYRAMEAEVCATLRGLTGELAGSYHPLTGMSPATQQQLIRDHFLFKTGDRFLQAARACEHWPTGRGIFYNTDKTFLVWLNEEDHLRVIAMQRGGDLGAALTRLRRGLDAIAARLPFARDDRLGYLTFCPTNLGTTIRASVLIKLPHLGADRAKLEEVAGRYNLQVRGTAGEHSESADGTYDISNKRRLGLTEREAVLEMQRGVLELIRLEKQASST